MENGEDIVEKVLALLREWGWEAGARKLEREFQTVKDDRARPAQEAFLGWIAAEQGAYEEAQAHFRTVAQVPALAGWAFTAEAFVAIRQKDFQLAHQWLDRAAQQVGTDTMLHAAVTHLRATAFHHEGQSERARPLLVEALKLVGDHHFATGRILDALGMIYAARGNFHAAQEFFEKAVERKTRHGDMAGLALSHGQLGRLCLDWGLWDKAERHFQEDLQISQPIGDEFGQAQMYNFLGLLAFIRGEMDHAVGRQSSAANHWDTAAGWLDASIRLGQERRWAVLEGFARKDRAQVHVSRKNWIEAEQQLQQAEQLFQTRQFKEGLAHVHRVLGVLRCRQGRVPEALPLLRASLRYFVECDDGVEIARTQFEIGRVHRAAEDPRPLVSHALQDALNRAESCRRTELVRQIEEELKVVDPETYRNHVYQRVRGRAVSEDTTSLISGVRETASVLFLDLKGSTDFARERDPEEVMMTLNQLMADLVSVLRHQDARVSVFRGDGFLALLRGMDHACRAVMAGLELFEALAVFNEPRAILDLPLFTARIGIASGEVFLGNVGTYDKMDFTAIGTTVNLGARLESEARAGMPGISRATYELVRDRFLFMEDNPRKIQPKGLPEQEIWDVTGPKAN